MNVDALCREISRVPLSAPDDMRELIAALSSRAAGEFGELHVAVAHLDDAYDACPAIAVKREPGSCTRCAGTGEGRSDRTVCLVCRGSGVERRAA